MLGGREQSGDASGHPVPVCQQSGWVCLDLRVNVYFLNAVTFSSCHTDPCGQEE